MIYHNFVLSGNFRDVLLAFAGFMLLATAL
jgi:hypothetical protein